MVGSTKDMLDSNVPPLTEEVVSKSEAPKLADTRSKREKRILEALQNKIFRRSTYIPIQVHTVDSNCPLAVKALIDCGAMGEFIDHEFVRAHELRTYQLPHPIRLYNADGLPNEIRRSLKQSISLSSTRVIRAGPNSMSRMLAIRQSSWDTLGLQSTTLTSTGA